MFKRPAYISILVGFLSIYSVLMVFIFLRAVFVSGEAGAQPGATAAQAATAQAAQIASLGDDTIIPKNDMPFIGLVYSIIAFVCTVNMLEGANWARWLYTVSYLGILICDILAFSDHFLPYVASLVIRGIVVPFLFFPAANEFFRKAD